MFYCCVLPQLKFLHDLHKLVIQENAALKNFKFFFPGLTTIAPDSVKKSPLIASVSVISL